jgi:acetolactate synthase-1/2/3 large subunit
MAGAARIDGGTMLIRVLRQAGIDTLFTLHGGHLDAILQAAADDGMRLIDTRHEQAAGHAADGWARTTGRPGVAIVTAGPGMTDCVTAIANAYLDCVPTLFIAGAAPLREAETMPLQGGLDQVAMVTPITKWAHRVTHTERIPDLVAQALRVAVSGRPGPVFLELPIDVLFSRVEESRVAFPEKIFPDCAPAPAPEAVSRAIEWLHAAERPAILAGGGAWFSGAGDDLLRFAERTGTPVFSNSKAHGLVPGDHPLCGRGFAHLAIAAGTGVGSADLVLVLGARLGLFTGGRGARLIPSGARLIQIDIAAEEIGRNRTVDLGIAADCREAVRALDAAASDRKWPDRSAWCEGIRRVRDGHRALFAAALEKKEPPIHPYRLAFEIARALPRDAIVAADGGETSAWMETVAEVHGGGRYLSHGYLGCLGTGMPFAIAAKVAHPDRPVVCVVGDGSVGLNFAEFDTMVRHGLAIVTVVNNDQLWGMSAHGQDLIYGKERRVATELAPTRYDEAAAGFGCHGEQVVEPAELPAALERAFRSGRPACVNVMTDGSVIAPITLAMVGSLTESAEGAAGEGAPREGSKGETIRIPYYENLKD